MMSIEEALRPLVVTLQADGYDAVIRANDEVVAFQITAGPEACEECLSPRAIMEPIITHALREAGFHQHLDLTYPAEH
jgi:hypothetical protein